MFYNEEFETLPREAIQALQIKRLQQVLQRVYHTVGHYKKSLDAARVKPDDIKSLADLSRLPFITRHDLQNNYPFGLFGRPYEQRRPAACLLRHQWSFYRLWLYQT